mmetsp:Transcript_114/g.207  ORF Transcript_114/g.207 Transcript_114/m.207 type:complete len:302 (-) Transcript_114:181-1086(-)
MRIISNALVLAILLSLCLCNAKDLLYLHDVAAIEEGALQKRRVTKEIRPVTGVQREQGGFEHDRLVQEDADSSTSKQESSTTDEGDEDNELNSRDMTFFSVGILMMAIFFKILCQDGFFSMYLANIGLLPRNAIDIEEEAEETEEEKRQRFLRSFGESKKKLVEDDMISNGSYHNTVCNDIETGYNGEEETFGIAVDLQIQDSNTGGTKKISNICAICLTEYEIGDEIVWSCIEDENSRCKHAFHEDCMLMWALKIGEEDVKCPCCRQSFCKIIPPRPRSSSINETERSVNDHNHQPVTIF